MEPAKCALAQASRERARVIAGLIYAGGLGRRMGGADKPFAVLAGAPLVSWAAARLRPQVATLAVAARGDCARFAALDVVVVTDPDEAGASAWGPIAGLAAGLAWAQGRGATWLATAPADAPFAPVGFVRALINAAGAAPAAIAADHSGRQPTFAVWRADLAPRIADLAAGGMRALHAAADAVGAVSHTLAATDPPWSFNVNTPADLAAAEAIVTRLDLRHGEFSAE